MSPMLVSNGGCPAYYGFQKPAGPRALACLGPSHYYSTRALLWYRAGRSLAEQAKNRRVRGRQYKQRMAWRPWAKKVYCCTASTPPASSHWDFFMAVCDMELNPFLYFKRIPKGDVFKFKTPA